MSLRRSCLFVLCAGAVAPALAQGLDLGEAIARARDAAGPVRSARLNAEARQLQADALRHVHRPSIALTGFAGRVRTAINFDITRLSEAVNPVIGPGGLDLPLPPVPTVVSLERSFDQATVSLSGALPLYSGGRLEALRDVAAGRASEARAELQEEDERSATAVTERYFAAQLAAQARQVREAALAGVREHLEAAKKLEAAGLIARADRLKADVALADAQREAAKAASDMEIARLALARQVGLAALPPLATPLFVHSRPVGSLESFVEAGLRGNPAWDRIAAKRAQADAARRLAGSEHAPTVLGVGTYNFNRSTAQAVQPTWFVGLLVRMPLVGPVDKRAMAEAARLDAERVELAAQQAERDIPTLVENHWRKMENARAAVLAMEPQIALARENLRLQEVAFAQQQATVLDVIDARLGLARAQVQRSQAAYDYVMALARLLEVTGQSGKLADYAKDADIRIAPGLD